MRPEDWARMGWAQRKKWVDAQRKKARLAPSVGTVQEHARRLLAARPPDPDAAIHVSELLHYTSRKRTA